MLIRKLVVAATLVAAGAAAYAGPTSAGGKDVGNLTDSLFGSKMYTGLAVNASPAAAPVLEVNASPAAAPFLEVNASPAAAPVLEVTSPAISVDLAADIGGSASVAVPMPAAIPAVGAVADVLAPGLVTPMADVPEPASMALMLAGIVGVGAMRRRKQQR